MTTRAGGLAMHVADRHVERWLRNDGAQEPSTAEPRVRRPHDRAVDRDRTRSASLGCSASTAPTAWRTSARRRVVVFPRPWYQDELDWMPRRAKRPDGAVRVGDADDARTYVRPKRPRVAAALYEYIAPSLSVAQPTTQAQGIGYGGSERRIRRWSRSRGAGGGGDAACGGAGDRHVTERDAGAAQRALDDLERAR